MELRPLETRPWSQVALEQLDAWALAALLEHTTETIVLLDRSGAIRFANPAAQALLGYPAGALIGAGAFDLVHPEDKPRALAALAELNSGRELGRPVHVRLLDQGGSWRHGEVHAKSLVLPALDGILLSVRDVTEQTGSGAALRISEQRFRDLAEHAPDCIFRCTPGPHPMFLYVSPALETITGYHPAELLGDPTMLRRLVDAAVYEAFISPGQEIDLLTPIEFAVHCRDGSDVWAQLRLTPHRNLDGEIVVIDGILRDLTALKRREDAFRRQALHDPLTGLPNRALFYDRLDQALARRDRLPQSPAVLFVDLDEFKAVNDRHGHAAGDYVHTTVARRLIDAVRPGDTVARLGGDEFLILCDDITGDAQLDYLTERIRDAISTPLGLAGGDVAVALSIGAVRAQTEADADSLVRAADEAMYVDKAAGRNGTRRKAYLTRDPSPAGRRRPTDHVGD